MIPGLAHSVSLASTPLTSTVDMEAVLGTGALRYVTVRYDADNSEWLGNLTACLEKQNRVRRLAVAVEVPDVQVVPGVTQVLQLDLGPVRLLLEVLRDLRRFELVSLKRCTRESVDVDVDVEGAVVRVVESVWREYEMGRSLIPCRNRTVPGVYVDQRKFTFTKML